MRPRPRPAALRIAAGILVLGALAVAPRVAGAPPSESATAPEALPSPGGLLASQDDLLEAMYQAARGGDEGDGTAAGVTSALVPQAGVGTSAQDPGSTYTRIVRPTLPDGPRRVGIQAGHWLTEQAPPELWRLVTQTGASWDGVDEVQVDLDVALRVKALLEAKGYAVDLLPTTIPPGYIADAFVSLHADDDGTGEKSGFKLAHSTRRTPYEEALLQSVRREYASATGLPYDQAGISRNMLFYYALSWSRIRYATAPHTPSVILEMGFLSNEHDRAFMTEHADVVAAAIASGIDAFLAAHPREQLFGEDLLVPAFRFRPQPSPPSGP